MKTQTVFGSQLAEGLVVIGQNQVANRAPKIIKKAVADFAAADDAACGDRQVRHRIVAASINERLAKAASPIDPTDLPTIGVDVTQRITEVRLGRVQDRLHIGI